MEKLMQYVWQHKLFPPTGLKTVDGRRLCIINPGRLNTGPGPDFFNAVVEIDGQKWVGNVEIHISASDWFRHGHNNDPTYDSVILHVVDHDDSVVRRPDGDIIPQMRLPCDGNFSRSYNTLVGFAQSALPCSEIIKSLPKVYVTDWLTSLAYERVHSKATRIAELAGSLQGNWEEAAYITIARALGFSNNGDSFERLARSMPLKFLRKHTDSQLAVEAMLIGQAGLLPENLSANPYVYQLQCEYNFYARKFSLKSPESPGWRLSAVRPVNSPLRRIGLLAHIVCNSRNLMADIADISNISQARQFFSFDINGYWANHYTLDSNATDKNIGLASGSVNLLIINAIIPLLFAYHTELGDEGHADDAIEMLCDIPGEDNRLIAVFKQCADVRVRNAFISQALIQLRREYCEQSKCLYCRVGHRYLSARALRQSPSPQ